MNIDEFKFFSLASKNNLGEWSLSKKYSIDSGEIEFKIVLTQRDVYVYTSVRPTEQKGMICLTQCFIRSTGALVRGGWYGVGTDVSLHTIYEEIAQDSLCEGDLLLAMGRDIIKNYGQMK